MEDLVGPDPAFWQGKRVLVTGHTGFKGSWLALWLEMLGAQVSGLSLPPQPVSGGPPLWEGFGRPGGDVFVDIRDAAAVRAAVAAAKPAIVLHLAAQALVHPSYDDPADTFTTNVIGLVNVFDAVRANDCVQAIVNVTSDKCYENVEHVWPYRESEPMGGSDPYSASKGCAELVTSAYRRSFFKAPGTAGLASARAGNVFGGGDWAADRLVPDCIRAFAARKPLLVRNPLSTRPWQHVLEPLSGYLVLAQRLYEQGDPVAEAWNFGPADADAWPVHRVVETVAKSWGDDAGWEQDRRERPHEAMLLRVDASKARAGLKWRPRLPIGQGLAWTVDWYRQALDGADIRQLTMNQIDAYQDLAG